MSKSLSFLVLAGSLILSCGINASEITQSDIDKRIQSFKEKFETYSEGNQIGWYFALSKTNKVLEFCIQHNNYEPSFIDKVCKSLSIANLFVSGSSRDYIEKIIGLKFYSFSSALSMKKEFMSLKQEEYDAMTVGEKEMCNEVMLALIPMDQASAELIIDINKRLLKELKIKVKSKL